MPKNKAVRVTPIPTPVGVNREIDDALAAFGSYPHARGGEPLNADVFKPNHVLSPRPWG